MEYADGKKIHRNETIYIKLMELLFISDFSLLGGDLQMKVK